MPEATFDLAPPRRKVAIVGFAPSTRDLAPFADPSYEIWAMNQNYRFIPRLTRQFELHPHTGPRSYLTDQAPGTNYFGWLARCPVPIYMVTAHPEIPTSIEFPLDAITKRFGLASLRADLAEKGYYHSSVDYMIGLALLEGVEEVAIYGIDMSHDTEYCVSPETRVLTADLRWVPASKIGVGDSLIGFDEEPGTGTGKQHGEGPCYFRRWQRADVVSAVPLTRPCYRLTLADGSILVSSSEHRWLTNSMHQHAWRRTDALVTPRHQANRPSRLVKLLDVWNEDRSWDAGYLAAAFDGEGCLRQSSRHHGGAAVTLQYAQKDNAMAAQFTASVQALGFATSRKPNGSVFQHDVIGGRSEIFALLGTVRPRRLLSHFDANTLGQMRAKSNVPVVSAEFIGEQPVIGLGTTTGTFVAEGFASHNSRQKPSASFWIGLAHGLGVRVTIPEASALLNNVGYRYGYDAEEAFPDVTQAEGRLRALNERLGQLATEQAQIQAMAQDTAHWLEYFKAKSRGAKV